MNVLIAIRGYYPSVKHGGPPISIQNLCEATGEEIQYNIITTNHDKGEEKTLDGISPGWNDVGKAKVWYLPDSQETYKYIDKIIEDASPDLLYIQSLFDYKYTINLLRIAKKRNIPCILAVRGELSSGVFKKKYKKLPYIFFLKKSGLLSKIVFHATYDDERDSIQKVLCNKNQTVDVIQNLPVTVSAEEGETEKTPGKLKAVFISRIVVNKNLLDVLKSLKNVKAEVELDIYGFKQDPEYWNTCEKEIESLPENITAKYCGALRHEDVVKTIRGYDAMIFPTYSENYGQIIAESVLASCPVIISDKTPWNDLKDTDASYVVPLHDLDALTEAIEKVASMDKVEYDGLVQRLQKYKDEKMDIKNTADKYVALFKRMLS